MTTEEKIDLLVQGIGELQVKMQSIINKSSNDRVGGLPLAMEVTGYSKQTIYKKIKQGMPHSKKDGNVLRFSEKMMKEWMITGNKSKTRVGVKSRLLV